jgi:hypothetical protein
LTAEYEKSGVLPPETPIFTGEGIKLFTDEKNAATLKKVLNGNQTLADSGFPIAGCRTSFQAVHPTELAGI